MMLKGNGIRRNARRLMNNALLLITAIAMGSHSLQAGEPTTKNSTIAFWPLDEGRGGEVKNRQSDDFHGAVMGKGFTWKEGLASFPGSKVGGHIRVADGGSLMAGPAFEFSLDVKPVTDAIGPLLGTKSNSDTGGGFNLSYWSKGKRFSFNFADGTRVHSFRFKHKLPADQWSHISLRYDGENLVALVNEKEIGRHFQPGLFLNSNPGAALLIGGYTYGTDAWEGGIRNVRLKSLSSVQSDSVVHTSVPPKIDGSLDDMTWKDVKFQKLPLEPQTTYALTADEGHLYIAVRCMGKEAGDKQSDPLRIQIDPEMTGHRRYQLTLHSDNKYSTALVSYYGRLLQDQFAISKLVTATQKGANGWSAEIAIPFSSLAVAEGNPPYWNFCIDRMGSGGGKSKQQAMRTIENMPKPNYTVKEKSSMASLIHRWKLNDPAPRDQDLKLRPSHDTWFVANNLVVPNWFLTDLPAKSISEFGAHLIIDIPKGIELLHVGTFKSDDPIKTRLRKSRFAWKKETPDKAITHAGSNYTRYRIEVTEIHQRLNTIGPFYFRSSLADDTKQKLYFQTVYPGGEQKMESLQLLTKKFPTPGMPKKLLASLTWMSTEDYMNWPSLFDNYSKLGFNALSMQRRDRGLLDKGAGDFLDQARGKGFYIIAVDSSFHGLKNEEGAQSLLSSGRRVHDVCPAYRGSEYQEEIQIVASWSAENQADYLVLDVECFQKGSDLGLNRACSRCVDFIDQSKLSPVDAMVALGTEIQKDIHEAVREAHAKADIDAPNIGFYHSKPGGFIYQNTLSFDESYPQSVGHAQPVFYNTKKDSTGAEIRRLRALMEDGDLMPWFTAGFYVIGSRPIEFPSAWVYDRVLEGYGNGIRGINWFTFKNFEAADFFYYAAAMKAVNQVEELIYDSRLIEGVKAKQPYKATAITSDKTGEILLLVSEYDQATTGEVSVTFAEAIVEGSYLYDLARQKKLKAVSGKSISFSFSPGIEGAHSALFLIKK